MKGYESRHPHDDEHDEDNVVMFRPRAAKRPTEPAEQSFDMARFPVDIRGNVTFGRLLSGLSTVGLTVRVDARTGRVIIADEATG